MDVMISDLPHIQYHPKDNISKQQEEDVFLLSKNEQEKIKKEGLAGLGLNLNFKAIDGNALIQHKEKKG